MAGLGVVIVLVGVLGGRLDQARSGR
jgi:thiamine pyrophosphokinase